MWLTVVIGSLLAIGFAALFSETGNAILARFAQGRFEPLAVALLIGGAATTALGLRRMAGLNEDMPWYRGSTAGSWEQYRTASERAASNRGLRPGLRERQEEKRVARLIAHARQAPRSWWSSACRWQMMLGIGWLAWLIWVLATLAMLLLGMWLVKGPFGMTHNLMACGLLLLLPMAALAGQFLQRKGIMGRELLLPVARGLYLKQLGTSAALCQIQCWSAVTTATFFWWLVVVPESVSGGTIAGIVVIGGFAQIWLFAAAAWLMRHQKMVLALGLIVSLAVGFLAPTVTNGFTVAPWRTEWRDALGIAVVVLTLFAAFLIWAAYRRWLVADID